MAGLQLSSAEVSALHVWYDVSRVCARMLGEGSLGCSSFFFVKRCEKESSVTVTVTVTVCVTVRHGAHSHKPGPEWFSHIKSPWDTEKLDLLDNNH
jgi:hypothetical protein